MEFGPGLGFQWVKQACAMLNLAGFGPWSQGLGLGLGLGLRFHPPAQG